MSEITHLQARVGADPGTDGDGTSSAVRKSKQGGLLVAPISGSYQEAVRRGNCYAVANQVGVTSQAGLSATTPVLTLFNPGDSGVLLVVWFVGSAMTVVNATVGVVMVAVNTDTAAAAVTGTATSTHRNCLLGSSRNPQAEPLLAATLPAAPVSIGTIAHQLTGAVNLFPSAPAYGRWYDGGLILKPNTALSLQTKVASGAAGLWCEYIWEEIPA